MIVNAIDGDQIEIITQIDHARLAAELLGLWIRDGLPEHPRREELLFAVREHDNGWRENDSAPMLDPRTGDRPYDFVAMPAEIRVDLWRVGCQRFRREYPYASLLIVEHARHLHAERPEDIYRDLLEWLEDHRTELLGETGEHRENLDADYAFLELTDLISLVACTDWTEPFESRGTTIEKRGGILRLDPFPLAGTTTFRIPIRTIPRRSYHSTIELAGELATARWKWREIRIGS